MTTIVAGVAAKLGWETAKAAVNYGAEAAGAHVAMGTLNNIKGGIENYGAQVAGPAGKAVGNIFGRAAAGLAIEAAQSEGLHVANAIKTVSDQAFIVMTAQTTTTTPVQTGGKVITDQTKAVEEQPQGPSLASKIYTTTKALATIGGGIAVATGLAPAVPIGLAVAAYSALPRIVEATLAKADPNKETVSLVNDVVIPVMTQAAIQSAGVVVEGVVRYDTVKGTYDAVVQNGENIGRGIVWFMPQKIQDAAGTLGRWIGTVDAARTAMSSETIRQATEKGELARNFTVVGLETVDATVKMATAKNNSENSAWRTAKNVTIITAGILGGAALVYVAPATATVVGGTAIIGVADRAIRWTKLKLTPKEIAAEAKVEPAKDEQITDDGFVLIEIKNLDKLQDTANLTRQMAIATLAQANEAKFPVRMEIAAAA